MPIKVAANTAASVSSSVAGKRDMNIELQHTGMPKTKERPRSPCRTPCTACHIAPDVVVRVRRNQHVDGIADGVDADEDEAHMTSTTCRNSK